MSISDTGKLIKKKIHQDWNICVQERKRKLQSMKDKYMIRPEK